MDTSTRSLILSRPTVVATLLTAFTLVVGCVALSAFSASEIGSADRRAARAQQSLTVLNQLQATITEAETAQRGYILTRDEKYLLPYEGARPRYTEQFATLAAQFADTPARAAAIAQLKGLFDQRFAEIERTIRLRRDHGIAPALNVVESDEGWRLMNEIRQRLQTLQREELGAIAAHTKSAAEIARVFQYLNGGMLALATTLAGAVTVFAIRRLHQLEGLIKVCAWTKQVQWQGRWISFEEYLAQRFNLHVTHGISDEAAQRLGREIAETPLPPER